MQKPITTVFILAAALTASRSLEGLAQDAASRAAAVLADARKALGGDDALRAVKTLQAAGDFRRTRGGMDMEGELEILLETPDKLRRNEEIAMLGGARVVRTEVLNGDDVWDDGGQRGGHGGGMQIVMRGPGSDLDPARMKEMQRRARRNELARHALAWLLTTEGEVRHAGIAEAPDGRADVLEVVATAAPPMRLFVDQQTHLPLMVVWQGPEPRVTVRRETGPPGGAGVNPAEPEDSGPPPQATFEMRLADYRVVDGVRLPHQVTRSINGQTYEEWTIASYKVNPSFKSKTFTK